VLNAADLFDDDNAEYSLAELARAIAYAVRRDNVPVFRAFIRTRGNRFIREVRTQRIRVRFQAGVIKQTLAHDHAISR